LLRSRLRHWGLGAPRMCARSTSGQADLIRKTGFDSIVSGLRRVGTAHINESPTTRPGGLYACSESNIIANNKLNRTDHARR
jgi:hypothetical protein